MTAPAPLVTDMAVYDAKRMERARLDRYVDRLNAAAAAADDVDAFQAGVIRRFIAGVQIKAAIEARPIPKHRALVPYLPPVFAPAEVEAHATKEWEKAADSKAQLAWLLRWADADAIVSALERSPEFDELLDHAAEQQLRAEWRA